ncbi:cobalt/nickel transport system permease protein [Natranaerovirga hydrolytica]|uniref:Cobalt/nickel transport system permease protein n=1 Tax=Natranaerovirga hydrolytica TaxID=680378 RepID=A0A4V2Q1J2_9FIRM|nr:energy-coupling factor ABC transporter permease [Natranaerovirga hydrolytica]TCK97771.1 cobalt/nickel transport system permease protein [Natranaerovirga hydrolytica]
MSHIHIPDGILPFYMWFGGYLVSFLILGILFKKLKTEETKKKIPYTGVAAALMLITMSVPLGIVPVHLSLATLSGILVGPGLGFIAVFVVNLILAFVGHGGITVVGLNTLVIGIELFIGVSLFRLFIKTLKPYISAGISTAVAILTSLVFMILIVGSVAGLTEALPHHHNEHNHVQEYHEDESDHHHSFLEEVEDVRYFMFTGFMALFMIVAAGIVLEAFITIAIIKFFLKIRPDIIQNNHKFSEL